MSILDNILEINDRIAKAALRAEKNFKDITLVAVTKTVDIQDIFTAINCGIKITGENRIQEAKNKYEFVKDKVKLHFIGHLQKNKVREAVKMFDMIQSVDSLSLAQELSKECEKQNKILDILIEVKTSSEPAKFGMNPDEVKENLKEIIKLPELRLKGLMTIADFSEDLNRVRSCFTRLRKIKEELRYPELIYLSMGMTNDFEIAIEEGSNMVRIGSGIFKDLHLKC
ncbi:MAG: YggS family pyridoxal phosphate-dependent enzyme [Candidatus Firestonebacteria bacterium]|nr:YggS family pyridoxal phosphate-dependent enzyme [Candidatus Firestonebacteria bacterium]